MSDTPRTDKEAIGFVRLLVDHGTRDSPKFDVTEIISSNFARQLERELSAANARIAELEDAVTGFLRYCNEHERGWYSDGVAGLAAAYARSTAPSQPTTLPESKQQK